MGAECGGPMLVQLLSCPQFSRGCTYGWERFLTERCAHYLHYTFSLLPIPANRKKRQWEVLTASASWSLPDTHTEIIKVFQLYVCHVQGFVGDGGRQSEYNLKWKYTFYNFSF